MMNQENYVNVNDLHRFTPHKRDGVGGPRSRSIEWLLSGLWRLLSEDRHRQTPEWRLSPGFELVSEGLGGCPPNSTSSAKGWSGARVSGVNDHLTVLGVVIAVRRSPSAKAIDVPVEHAESRGD